MPASRPPQAPSVRHRLGLAPWGCFLVLLVLPVLALSHLALEVDWRVLAAGPVLMSGLTFLSYRSDKQRAAAGEWRIAESTLHLMALLGGWPGAYWARLIFRHKTAKLSFRITFFMVVLAHQFLAADFLLGWRMSQAVIRLGRFFAGGA